MKAAKQAAKPKPETELDLQIRVVSYLQSTYPDALFNGAQILASIPLRNKGFAKRAKQAGNTKGWPDLFISEARNGFSGLFIELKSESARVYCKDGAAASEHIALQLETIKELKARGYEAVLCVGYDEARRTIDEYFRRG